MNLIRCLQQPIAKQSWASLSSAFQTCAVRSASALAEIKFRPYKDLSVTAKRPKRPPFVARFFRAEIDEEMLTYPELSGEQLKRLNDMVSIIQGVYDSTGNTENANSSKEIPDNLLSSLKSLGLFSQQVPAQYGGLELGAMEMNRFAEVISQNPSVFHMINFHNIFGVQILLSAGTEAQKQKYLPKLASGESTFAPCIWEQNCGSDLLSMETVATPMDRETYFISGTKVWVNNAKNADSLLVIADTRPSGSKSEDRSLTAFIVDKSSPGITMKPVEKTCVDQLEMFEVSFRDTAVKASDMIGKPGDGFELVNKALCSPRSVMASAVLKTVRSVFDNLVNHVIRRHQFGVPLFDFNLIKVKLTEMSTKLYALESMIYMTAGIFDEYENQDVTVEALITKVYALETLQFCLKLFSDMFAGRLIEKDFAPVAYIKDAPFFNVCEGTKDMLKMQITLLCLRSMGEHVHEHVTKARNPLQFPKEKFRDLLFSVKHSKDRPTLTHVIANNLHPSLVQEADNTEYCIQRLRWAADLNIVHAGAEITNNQHLMIGLADIVTECYAMTASIARASRSYCIGMKNADVEAMSAHIYIIQNLAKVRRLVEYFDPHNPPVHDITIYNIAEAIGISKGYFAEHPTQRVYG